MSVRRGPVVRDQANLLDRLERLEAENARLRADRSRERSPSLCGEGMLEHNEKPLARFETEPIKGTNQRRRTGNIEILNPFSGRYVSMTGAVGKELLREKRSMVTSGGKTTNYTLAPPALDYINSIQSLGGSASLGAERRHRTVGSSSRSGLTDKDQILEFSYLGKTVTVGSNDYNRYVQSNPSAVAQALRSQGSMEARRLGDAIEREHRAGHIVEPTWVTGTSEAGRTIPIRVGGKAWSQNIIKGLEPGTDYMNDREKRDRSAVNKDLRASSRRPASQNISIKIPMGAQRANGSRAPIVYGGKTHIDAVLAGANEADYDRALDAASGKYTQEQIDDLKDSVAAEIAERRGVQRPARSRSPSASRASASVRSPSRSPSRGSSRSPSPAFELEEEEFIPTRSRSTSATRVASPSSTRSATAPTRTATRRRAPVQNE